MATVNVDFSPEQSSTLREMIEDQLAPLRARAEAAEADLATLRTAVPKGDDMACVIEALDEMDERRADPGGDLDRIRAMLVRLRDLTAEGAK
jgi:hypothetical protein